MNGFTYYTPTKVIFGTDTVSKLAELLKEQECKSILVVYGGGSVVRSGLLEQVTTTIAANKMSCVTLGGIIPNPLLSKVYEGIELGKKEKVDLILAVGGGSVIDTCKAIGFGLYHDGDVWDFFDGTRTTEGCIPIASILTIPAAGSEMSNGCVITKDEGLFKRSCGHPDCICKFAIMDPNLTLTLPDYQTAAGCVDIMMHTMERYFNGSSSNLDITDSVSEALLKSMMKNALILTKDPSNLEARWNVMWAGSLAHNGLTGCGTDGGDWSTHDIEHELGGMYDVTHGAGLAAVWGSWARYVLNAIPDRFVKFAINVMEVTPESNELDTAIKGIEAMENFYRAIHMPTSLSELSVSPTEEEFEEMAMKGCNFETTTMGSAMTLGKDDIKAILKAADH